MVLQIHPRVIPYQITQRKKMFPVKIIDFTHKNFDPIHGAMQNFISVLQIVSEIWLFKFFTPSRLKFRLLVDSVAWNNQEKYDHQKGVLELS